MARWGRGIGVSSHAPIPSSVYFPSTSFPFYASGEPVPSLLDKIEILERAGPYELLLAGGQYFLRTGNVWAGTAEYEWLDFQAASINAALKKLGKPLPDGEDAEFRAMLALEECIAHKAEIGMLDGEKAETTWQRYLKLKALAVQPGTPAEGMTATKMALKMAIELAL